MSHPPAAPVHIDPVTGAVSRVPVKPCCHSGNATAANNTTTVLLAVSAAAAVVGIGYVAYRAYQQSLFVSAVRPARQPQTVTVARDGYTEYHVSDPSQFHSTLSRALAQSQSSRRPVFVLVEGSKDSVTGRSWCGDCVDAEPIIDRVFTDYHTADIVRAFVSRDSYKSSTPHPYKTDALLKVQRIPTLYKLVDGAVVGQLVETELHDEERVRKFVRG